MRIRSETIYLCLTAVLLSVSCNKEKSFDCLKSTGKVTEEVRSLPPFSEIILRDGLDLVFVPDTVQKVVVKAGENLLPKIHATVDEGVLTLENTNYCNWVRSFEKELAVYVHHDTSSLKLYHRGFGIVRGKVQSRLFLLYYFSNESSELEFDSDYLLLEMYHLGNVTLTGRIREVASFRHETGRIEASTLNADVFRINDHGQGESHIRATQLAEVNILGEGDVVVYGKPNEKQFLYKGSGKVIVIE